MGNESYVSPLVFMSGLFCSHIVVTLVVVMFTCVAWSAPPEKKTPSQKKTADTVKTAEPTKRSPKKISTEGTTKEAEHKDSNPSDAPKIEVPDKPTVIIKPGKKEAAVSTMEAGELAGFDSYSPALQILVRKALELTKLNLRYTFGSSDPSAGGMDCSGTIYRLLMDNGIKDVPRQSDEICRWLMHDSLLYRTENAVKLQDTSFSALQPGDLLFWTGTYETSVPRDLPITHVMVYLGKRKDNGKPVIFGASDGRAYEGQRRNGVSIFDFPIPNRESKAAFYGYGPIPGLKTSSPVTKTEGALKNNDGPAS